LNTICTIQTAPFGRRVYTPLRCRNVAPLIEIIKCPDVLSKDN
jgi:hypothetical protein